MPRITTLEPTKDRSKNLWYICIPAEFSNTGKWKREYFSNRDKARGRSAELKRIKRDKDHYSAKATPKLIRDAVECDSIAQLYGYSGMREAFIAWSKAFEKDKVSLTFCELLNAYEKDHGENWSKGYLTGRWRPFRKKMTPIENEVITLMDTDYWREWAGKWREEHNPAPSTYNQIIGLLRSLFRHEKARDAFVHNPIEPLPALKNVKSEVCVSSPEEVKNLLEWTWKNDRELIPYFVLGYFAGLRPIAEIQPFTFEQINFEENLLNVITTKTARNPRRQVPLEANALAWLKPFQNQKGLVAPSNLSKRLARAKKESGTSWGHDIMRHSYGSYWEAANRKQAGCREQLAYQMGHSNFKTFEQYYRNDRSVKEAQEYWSILPPEK